MIFNKVTETIKEHHLIERKQHIVVGLSGGPDSVCLFDVLLRLRRTMGIEVYPVHVNHKFRPGEAERDQDYVERLCREKGVECRTFTVDCVKLAEELKITGEEAGRKARYNAFYETAREICRELEKKERGFTEPPIVKIAVAHNADDQAETILFRLMRGTGVDGLAGISYKRQERGFEVIRPVLDLTRKEIETYCEEQQLHPVTDHTNNEDIYTRNKIRLNLIPQIEQDFNENIKESLVRLGRIAAADKDLIWGQVEEQYEKLLVSEDIFEGANSGEKGKGGVIVMDREGLSRAHLAIRHRIIIRAFGKIGLDKDISEERIKAADFIILKKQSPKTVEFPRGYRLSVAKGLVKFFNG